MVLFAADLHLGQRTVCRWRQQFSSVEEHDAVVTENILRQLNKNTVLYLLGDVVISWSGWNSIRAFRDTGAKVILIPGNHCTERFSMSRLAVEYDEIHASLCKYGMWLTHQPLHPDHLRGKLCVHGHLHDKVIEDDRYLCVSLEQTGYRAISLDEVRQIFSNRDMLASV